MATYAYQQNYFTASDGYVKYNISPDFGTPIAPGETVTVTGIVYCSKQANTELDIRLYNSVTETKWANSKTACILNIKIPKGKATSFTATFEMPVLKDNIFGTDRLRYAWICFDLCNENGNGDETVAVDTQKVSYLAYRINPKIIGADFVRCALMGETYKANDEGTKAFGSLSISLADGYTASDITIAKAVITPAGGASTSVSIAQSILASALTATGYSEINSNGEVTITPSTALFSTYTFDTAYDYDIKITIGDAYNTYSYDFDIARSFANVHLSGNAAGGVCFGGFCDSDNPGRFECHYPAYFYNGITVGGGSGGSIALETDTLLFGFMSNGRKDIYLSVPVPYMPTNVTTATVESIKGNVRCAGGYGAASEYVETGTDYTSLVSTVTPCPSTGTVTIKLTRSSAMNGTNNHALTFQVNELKMTIS